MEPQSFTITESTSNAKLLLASHDGIKVELAENCKRPAKQRLPLFILSIHDHLLEFNKHTCLAEHLHVELSNISKQVEYFETVILPKCLAFLTKAMSTNSARVLIYYEPDTSPPQTITITLTFLKQFQGESTEMVLDELKALVPTLKVPDESFLKSMIQMDEKDKADCLAAYADYKQRVLVQYENWRFDGGLFDERVCDKHRSTGHDDLCGTCQYLTVSSTYDQRRYRALITKGIHGHKCGFSYTCPPGTGHNPNCYNCREQTLNWHHDVMVDNPDLNARSFLWHRNCKTWHNHVLD